MSGCTVLPMLRKTNVSGIYMLSLIFNPQLKDFLFSFPWIKDLCENLNSLNDR